VLEICAGAEEALIRLDAVERSYGRGVGVCEALRGVTAAIRRGTFAALVGPSGSGKTTLLNLIAGLDTPTSGTVRIEGCDLASMSEGEMSDLRLRRIGFVFQNFNLVPVLSAEENVAFPLLFRREIGRRERRERVAEVLRRVGLDGKEGRRPHELSGGERQRVALARALAGEPAIILADEPTANLDQETGAAIIHLMRSIGRQRGMTFLYSTHDPQLIAFADTVLKLRNGLIEMAVAA
jgi:putative ABC transport system ATP-binding protein